MTGGDGLPVIRMRVKGLARSPVSFGGGDREERQRVVLQHIGEACWHPAAAVPEPSRASSSRCWPFPSPSPLLSTNLLILHSPGEAHKEDQGLRR